MKNKFIHISILLVIIASSIFVFKTSILKGLASFLISEDQFTYVENAFILSGGAYDRGNTAAHLWNLQKINNLICTGQNQSPDLKVLQIDTLESDLSKLQLIKMGVPKKNIALLKKGTSTFEESEAILEYCMEQKLTEIAIISSKFHTKRVAQVFRKKFMQKNIQVYIIGAPSSVYNEMEWWKNEYGLIALNNEYLKQLYYLFSY